jgi:hypothetical protein
MEEQQKMLTEDDVLDFIFHTLYINLDKNELHFENEIIAPSELDIDAKQLEHLRELILSTGYIKASVGFGKRGYIYLTQSGIQLIKLYNTYSNYTATLQAMPNSTTAPVQNQLSKEAPKEQPKYMDDEMAG